MYWCVVQTLRIALDDLEKWYFKLLPRKIACNQTWGVFPCCIGEIAVHFIIKQGRHIAGLAEMCDRFRWALRTADCEQRGFVLRECSA